MKQRLHRLATASAPLLACVALLGCAGIGPMGAPMTPKINPTPCNPGTCEMTVVVRSCANPGGIDVYPSFVSTDRRNTVMRWKIATPGYEFATNGIAIYSPEGEFQPLPSQDPSEFRLLNKNMKPGTHDYDYAIQVKVPRGLNCTVYDPWIRNSF